MTVWVLSYQYDWDTIKELLAVCGSKATAVSIMEDHWDYKPENMNKFWLEERTVQP